MVSRVRKRKTLNKRGNSFFEEYNFEILVFGLLSVGFFLLWEDWNIKSVTWSIITNIVRVVVTFIESTISTDPNTYTFTNAGKEGREGPSQSDINAAYASATEVFSTPKLTRLLEDIVASHPPPLVRGRRIKLRYAHTGGHNPPIVVIHGNQVDSLPKSYKRYLTNAYITALKLVGTPLQLVFKSTENPYEGKKNKLTTRQAKRRKRLMSWVKKRK